MNQKIGQLLEQCQLTKDKSTNIDTVKFNRLLVKECAIALQPMLNDMISRGQAVDLILKHFGIE
jgi:hypothetical protein